MSESSFEQEYYTIVGLSDNLTEKYFAKNLQYKFYAFNKQEVYYFLIIRQLANDTDEKKYDVLLVESNYCSFSEVFSCDCEFFKFNIFETVFFGEKYQKIIAQCDLGDPQECTHFRHYLTQEQIQLLNKEIMEFLESE